jgi:hypothetical protein
MMIFVILYNMIIKNERDLDLDFFNDNVGSQVKPKPIQDLRFP